MFSRAILVAVFIATAHAAAPDTSSATSGSTGGAPPEPIVVCNCECNHRNNDSKVISISYTASNNVTCPVCKSACKTNCIGVPPENDSHPNVGVGYCLSKISKSWVGTYESVLSSQCLDGEDPSLGACGGGCDTQHGCACLTGDVKITMVDGNYHMSGQGVAKDGKKFPTNANFKIVEPAHLNTKAIADSIYGFPNFSFPTHATLGYADVPLGQASAFQVQANIAFGKPCLMILSQKKKPKYTLIIALSVGGFLILVILAYCCCCRGKKEDKSSYKPLTANRSYK